MSPRPRRSSPGRDRSRTCWVQATSISRRRPDSAPRFGPPVERRRRARRVSAAARRAQAREQQHREDRASNSDHGEGYSTALRLLGPGAALYSRGYGSLEGALEIDPLEPTRPIHEGFAIRLGGLDGALANDSAAAPRGELQPALPNRRAFALAAHRACEVAVAVLVSNFGRELVKKIVHVRATRRIACQLRSRYRRDRRSRGLPLDHKHRGGTTWLETLCTSKSTRRTQVARSVSTARSSDGSTRTRRYLAWSTTSSTARVRAAP